MSVYENAGDLDNLESAQPSMALRAAMVDIPKLSNTARYKAEAEEKSADEEYHKTEQIDNTANLLFSLRHYIGIAVIAYAVDGLSL